MRIFLLSFVVLFSGCMSASKKREPAQSHSIRLTMNQALDTYGMTFSDSKDLTCYRIDGRETYLAAGTMQKDYVQPDTKCVWRIKCDIYSGDPDVATKMMVGAVQAEKMNSMDPCADALKMPGGSCDADKLQDEKDPIADCLKAR